METDVGIEHEWSRPRLTNHLLGSSPHLAVALVRRPRWMCWPWSMIIIDSKAEHALQANVGGVVRLLDYVDVRIPATRCAARLPVGLGLDPSEQRGLRDAIFGAQRAVCVVLEMQQLSVHCTLHRSGGGRCCRGQVRTGISE